MLFVLDNRVDGKQKQFVAVIKRAIEWNRTSNIVLIIWGECGAIHLTVLATVKAPPTIRYIPNFITEEEEKFLLSKIYSVPKPKWQQLLNRRVQNWGGIVGKGFLIPDGFIPLWLNSVIDKLMALGDTFPSDKRPNHVLVNEYLPGQGIMAHTDGLAFYPMVTTISLSSDTIVDYYKPIDPKRSNVKEERYLGSIFLERRSLILVSDDAYINCLHGIADRPFDVITNHIFNLENISRRIGEIMSRDLRVSLTIRNVPKVKEILQLI